MAKQVHIHIHRSKARDAGEGEGKGKWITLSPSGTHVKVDGKGEITAGPKGLTGKKPSELSKGKSQSPKPIKHATGQGQSFLPTQPKMGHGTVTKTGSGFTAKNHKGFKEYFKPHEEEQAKAYAASGKEDAPSTGKPEGGTPLKGSAGPATAKTESYSWGKLTKVGNVNESAIAHPKDREQIAALADGDSYQYTDEQGKQWKVTRHGEQAAFYKANAAKPALVAPLGEFQDTPHDPTGMAHAGRPQGTAAVQARIDAKKARAVSMASLKEGQALYDKSGQKVDEVESIQKRSMGKGLTINTRAGYQVHVDENGTNSQGWSNEKGSPR